MMIMIQVNIASETHQKKQIGRTCFFFFADHFCLPAQHPPKTSMEDHDVLPPPEAPVCQNTKITKSWKIETEKHHTHLYIKYVPVYAVYIYIYRYLIVYIYIYHAYIHICVNIYIYNIWKGSMFHPTMLQETGTFCFWYLHLKPTCVEYGETRL